MSNLITVIVPVYNVELYIEECLESLVSQTVQFDEIILINDGSTDKSHLICEEYCQKYPYLRLIDQMNKGLGETRNIGISQARGDYIVFVDADDYVEACLCARIKTILEMKNLEVLYYNANIQYDTKKEEKEDAYIHLDRLNGRIMTGMEYFCISFPKKYIVSVWNAAYKKTFLEKYDIVFPDGCYYEDNYFTLQVISSAQIVMCIPDSLYIRRCREDSITTGRFDEKKCCDMVTDQKLIWEYIVANHKWRSRLELLKRFVAQSVLNVFYVVSQCQDKSFADKQKELLTKDFLGKCLPVFFGKEYRWAESLSLLLILQNTKKIDAFNPNSCLVRHFFGTEEKFVECLAQARFVLERDFLQKLFVLPLNEKGVKVGIYGTGEHTAKFLELYKQFAGEINCELYFINTDCRKGLSFCGRPIVSCADIPEDTECIVLSSQIYQEEMRKNLLFEGIAEEKIVSFYEKDDICDLVTVNWVLQQVESITEFY